MSGHRARRGSRRIWLVASLGAVAALVAVPLLGSAPAEAEGGQIPGTPCDVGTTACVVLGHQGFNGKAWYISHGRVVRGPVPAATGGPGEDTPTGTFTVLSKDVDHRSTETRDAEGAPSAMPYSVFFTKSGVAFHGGGVPTNRTAGCVRLANGDAKYFFDNLEVGDTVQVVDGSTADYAPSRSHHSGGGGGLFGGL
ncbi:MAG TPA: L,D-transpeptidase [Pseudonocardia sp.]|nr:L,D-transpeptidase [Pseudonocardia sp.]